MQTVRNSEELALARGQLPGKVALVPTMGALHAGHMTLIAEARKRADRVVASIFVNPLQFNDPSDLGRYPRDEEGDLAQLKAAGCDVVWLPTPADLYAAGFATTIRVAGVSERWEGEHRPGHFEGVATVVARLLNEAAPDVVLFGEKDYQQLAVVRRMASDLGFSCAIVGVPTVRDSDGLALSSRNALLSDEERKRAAALPSALFQARDAIRSGEPVANALRQAKQALVDAGFLRIDYVALVDGQTLGPVDAIQEGSRLIAAAVIGTTRLIDNIAI